MKDEPILAETTTIEYGPRGKGRYKLTVYGGLHFIKGNSAPYFSLTCWSEADWGGANHGKILELFPQLSDLASLHLSDMWGVPMYAEAKGFYWVEGAFGGLGYPYHGGSGDSGKAPAECLAAFNRHMRFSECQAAEAWRDLSTLRDHYQESGAGPREVRSRLEERVRAMVGAQTTRWREEARACIAKHGLVIYGDPWHGKTYYDDDAA